MGDKGVIELKQRAEISILFFLFLYVMIVIKAVDHVMKDMVENPEIVELEIREIDDFSNKTEDSIEEKLENIDEEAELTKSKITELFAPLSNSGSKYSVFAVSLNDSSKIISVGNTVSKMVSASLIKLYVAGTVYKRMDDIKEFERYSGETESLLEDMISKSDNDACNILVKRLGDGDPEKGMREVNIFCKNNRFLLTEMNRLMLDFNGLENYTTTSDCCNFLTKCYRNELKGSERIVEYMKEQTITTKIPRGIADEIVVANKTGELSSVENDVAIIYAESDDYILCIMTNDLQDSSAARELIVQVSEEVYDYMTAN